MTRTKKQVIADIYLRYSSRLPSQDHGLFYLKSDFYDILHEAYDKGHEAGVQVIKDYLKGKEVRIPGTLKITPKEEDS